MSIKRLLLKRERQPSGTEKGAPKRADAFLAELDRAIERIAENPERYPHYVRGTRRYLLQRFPFYLVYREVAGKLEIVVVAHGRRRPGYWKNV